MSSLGDLREEFSDDIQETVNYLVGVLPLNGAQLRAAFTDDELAEIDILLTVLRAATSENERLAALVARGETALRLLGGLGVAI